MHNKRRTFNFFDFAEGAELSAPPERSSVAFDRGCQTGPPPSNAFFFGAVQLSLAFDIEAAKRGRLNQMLRFTAPLTICRMTPADGHQAAESKSSQIL